MAKRKDEDSSHGVKLLQLYQLLLLEDKKHFQSDLAQRLICSPQTIIRLAKEIEQAMPSCFQTGLQKSRRWYQLQPNLLKQSQLKFDELRYLSLCKELATPLLSPEITHRIDESIHHLSQWLVESEAEKLAKCQGAILFYNKGKIDYREKGQFIEDLLFIIEEQFFCHLSYKAIESKTVKNYYFIPKNYIILNQVSYIYGAICDSSGAMIKNTQILAVHRIQKLAMIKQKAVAIVPKLDKQTFGLPWHEPKLFTIQFNESTANYVRERIWSSEQEIEELENGGLLLKIKTSSEPELLAWVRSFGKGAKIIKDKK